MQKAYMSVTGQSQGKFKPEGNNPKHPDQIECLQVRFATSSPRDRERQHETLTLYKEQGPVAGPFFQALSNNEVLNLVIQLVRADSNGVEFVDATINASNAVVTSIKSIVNNARARHGAASSEVFYDEINFVCERIAVQHTVAGKSFTDNWNQ